MINGLPEMSITERGNGWTVEIDDSVMVWHFLPNMELDAFEREAYPVYDRLLGKYNISGMVTIVDLEDPFSSAVFALWEESVNHAQAAGVKRWAVVADGIKVISLQGKIDVGDLETYTTDNRTEAIEWARQD